jgi:hypothetical protein
LTFISRSQAGQDRFAYDHVISPGTFLDIGCNDPIFNSNSYALEQAGWRGLLVDFDAAMVELCKTIRTNPVILADATKVHWSGICSEYDLPNQIDYLSLDVDGPELLVLMNLISDGLSFRAITCEHDRYHRGDGPREAIRCFLIDHGYTLAVGDVKVFDQHYPNGVEFEDWWLK